MLLMVLGARISSAGPTGPCARVHLAPFAYQDDCVESGNIQKMNIIKTNWLIKICVYMYKGVVGCNFEIQAGSPSLSLEMKARQLFCPPQGKSTSCGIPFACACTGWWYAAKCMLLAMARHKRVQKVCSILGNRFLDPDRMDSPRMPQS